MIALLAVALAAAPGCPAALAGAAAAPDPPALAALAPDLVEDLARAGGGPITAVQEAARALSAAAAAQASLGGPATAFRAALERHCALGALPPAPGATAADRAALARILAQPELRRLRADPEALRRTVLGLWAALLEALGTSEAGRWAALGRALFLAGAVAAGLLALAALRRGRTAAARRGAVPGAAAAPGRPAADHAGAADAALARGDGREAVRRAFLLALGALERDGRVPPSGALTNAEVVRAAGAPLLADVAALARQFDAAVYGRRPVALPEAREALARARRVAAGAAP